MAHHVKSQKLVALKIGIPGDMGDRELKIQHEIIGAVKDVSRLLTLQSTFPLTGVNGTHLVMVFPVQGPSLYLKKLPVKTRMSAARQLLLAVKFFHDADIIHCDMNSGSVLWDIGDIHHYTPEMAYRDFGRADLEKRRAGETTAVKIGSPVKCKCQSPAIFCAPERFHNIYPSFFSDMWSYMCLFAELYLGFVLFHGRANTTALSNLVRSLGPLPPHWAGRYDADGTPEESWYDQTRTPYNPVTLEEITKRGRPDVSDVERKLVVSVFSKVFTYLPESRLTAAELLDDKDFNAIMAIYGC